MRKPIHEAFDADQWDKIGREIMAFKTSMLFHAYCVRIQDRIAEAQDNMEKEMETNNIYHYQGRVNAHKRDIMIFEDLLEIARKPFTRTIKNARPK